MTLSTFSMWGSIASLVAATVGFIWLMVAGKMQRTDMTEDEAIQRTQRALMNVRNPEKRVWFKGKGMGMSYSTEIATYDIILLMKQGRYAEAMPYAVTALGALGAFLFWPMWIMTIAGADLIVNILFTGFFFVSALRAAWPRASTSDLLKDPTRRF